MASLAFSRSSRAFDAAATDTKWYHCSSPLRNDRNSNEKVSQNLSFVAETSELSAATHICNRHGLPTAVANTLASNSSVARRTSAFRDKPTQAEQAKNKDPRGVKKNVHFDERFEHTRFFLPADAPIALTSNPAMMKEEEEEGVTTTGPTFSCGHRISPQMRYCLLNSPFSSHLAHRPIQLESIELSPTGKQIKGIITVLNLAFQKKVTARFTLDDWKTVSEVAADHRQSLRVGNSIVSDEFVFTIDMESSPLSTGRIFQVCVSYSVLGQEFWDNNGGMNYRVTLAI